MRVRRGGRGNDEGIGTERERERERESERDRERARQCASEDQRRKKTEQDTPMICTGLYF